MTVKSVTLNGYGPKSVQGAWKAREEFKANNSMHGEYLTAVWGETYGRLNAEERDTLCNASDWVKRYGGRLYVVFSYATPIAWVVTDSKGNEISVHKVAQKFSVTTSRHMGRLY